MTNGLYRPVPLLPVLTSPSERNHRVLLFWWGFSLVLSLVLGLIASRLDLSGVRVDVAGVPTYVTVYPPLVFSTLFCLWFGFWWGFVPAYVATFVLSQSAGMPFEWSLLFSLADPLGLAILAITYRAAPISVELRSFTSIVFYIFVTFVAALAGSSGSFIWSHTQQGPEVMPLAIWEGWWLGGFLQGVFINGIILRLAGPRVARWKTRLANVRPWTLPSTAEVGVVFVAGMLCVMGFVVANNTLQRQGVEEAIASVGGEAADTLRQFFQQLSAFNWVSLGLVAFSSVFGFVLALSWTRSLREAKEELQRARDDAERANSAKSKFLANMSHELRTPLTSVIGFAHVLLANPKQNLTEEELLFARRIRANGEHLLSLINEVLDLSRIEAGKLELELATVQLEELVPAVVAQVEGQAREKGLGLTVDVPEHMQPIRADPLRLQQVLLNVVGNAIKFTEKGFVKVKVLTETGNARPTAIQVIDSGIGIALEHQEDVFEAFEQLDSSDSRTHRGAGLGLPISRQLVREMGFDLEVSSHVGEGSTFAIVLTGEPTRAPG
ncbi:MAG: hypothetical protein JSW67_02790 [Candidatus Latescibacterota bacterium]|nr:MAG: hypothetical protein JSW67_02790 [Candidatus Latescibacterota bacterium]